MDLSPPAWRLSDLPLLINFSDPVAGHDPAAGPKLMIMWNPVPLTPALVVHCPESAVTHCPG